MGSVEPQNPKPGSSIKFPLSFSFAMGAVAGLVTLVVSAGGTKHGLRWDLGGVAFGIAFVATLLVASLLVMGHKENDPHLSEGSGVNLRSSDRMAQDKADAAAKAALDADKTEGDTA
ncbi:hypothetical protein AAGW05_08715 [Arthrobacter sp. LAPM80]|uniref:hypothetical protein n=1 Tax=Arthrobacter sp. LAPM80 TaxID=3141788 RepID=UPI00398AD679